MLLFNELQKFFETNDIPLECERILQPQEIDTLFLNALNQGKSFGSFILWTVINIERSGINTNFTSWDMLYDSYCAFMTGFMNANLTSHN